MVKTNKGFYFIVVFGFFLISCNKSFNSENLSFPIELGENTVEWSQCNDTCLFGQLFHFDTTTRIGYDLPSNISSFRMNTICSKETKGFTYICVYSVGFNPSRVFKKDSILENEFLIIQKIIWARKELGIRKFRRDELYPIDGKRISNRDLDQLQKRLEQFLKGDRNQLILLYNLRKDANKLKDTLKAHLSQLSELSEYEFGKRNVNVIIGDVDCYAE